MHVGLLLLLVGLDLLRFSHATLKPPLVVASGEQRLVFVADRDGGYEITLPDCEVDPSRITWSVTDQGKTVPRDPHYKVDTFRRECDALEDLFCIPRIGRILGQRGHTYVVTATDEPAAARFGRTMLSIGVKYDDFAECELRAQGIGAYFAALAACGIGVVFLLSIVGKILRSVCAR